MGSAKSSDGKTYLLVNRCLILVGLVFLVAVLAVHHTGVTTCWSRVMYGKDCVFCGCTRDFVRMSHGEAPCFNRASGWLLALAFAELVWRTVFSFMRARRLAVWTDMLLHAALALWLTVSNVVTLFCRI